MQLLTIDDLNKYSECLSVTEISQVLGMNQKTILKLIKSGELPAFKSGLKFMTTKKALILYVNSNKVK